MIKAVQFVVHDLDSSVRFFCDVLRFTFIEEREEKGKEFDKLYKLTQVKTKKAILKLGNEQIELVQCISHPGKPFPKDSISSDLCFQHIAIVVSDIDEAHSRLEEHNIVAISGAPQTIPEWNIPAAGIKAYYFRSPDFQPLELIYFPIDKGKQEWRSKESLFLGIDHTAIAISDKEKSLAFYQRAGFEVFGGTINYGETHEKLTGIVNAKVEITGLHVRDQKGIGLEFLRYLQGTQGRKRSYDPHDLMATKSMLSCKNLNTFLSGMPLASVISKADTMALLQDPDGHYVLVKEEYNSK